MSDPRIQLDPNLPKRGNASIIIVKDGNGALHMRAQGFSHMELIGVLESMKIRAVGYTRGLA
jgi:hypothetical protein